MTNRFMMSVAAIALIAGTSFANAQAVGGREGGGGSGPAAQQSAPSGDRGGAAPMSHDSAAPAGREAAEPTKPSSGMKATQSEQKTPAEQKAPGAANQRAEDKMQGQKPNNMRSETNAPNGGKDMKAEGRDNNMKPGDRDNKNADSKGTAERSQTTGQAGAGAKLSGEQRTKITSVIREQHVQPTTNVNFSISIGTRVPHDVRFHALPAEVITYYPEWRGYEFILVNEQIVVIDPRTFEIVAVIDA